MRGLAFPPTETFDRETSYEYGTPATNPDDIPIDPALGGPAIDPALMGEGLNGANHDLARRVNSLEHQPSPPSAYKQTQEYAEGPQGDPFAPQPLPMYFPVEVEQSLPPMKPVKRKRKPARERECGFCHGTDRKNQQGKPELMATCDECGRSGHPSCMELSGLGEILRSYPWNCVECKICEICHEKGDDDRILFCDFCDRGWHMDCMRPPIENAPKGRWHCPKCPPLPPQEEEEEEGFEEDLDSETSQLLPVVSDSQDLSRPPLVKSRSKGRGKGKGKIKDGISDESSLDGEIGIATTPQPRRRGRPKKIKLPPPKAPQYSDEDSQAQTSLRNPKRTRVQSLPVTRSLPRVRLQLGKGKGKEREEEEPLRGFFDDILSEGERDTLKTSITATDKQRFERSRLIAEEHLSQQPQPPRADSEFPDPPSTPGPSARPLRSHAFQAISSTPLAASASPAPSTPQPFSRGDPTALRIRSIRFGQYDIKTWYDAPFPEEYANIPDGRLWICEFCLKYMKSRFACERHRLKCKTRHPPGDEIYRDGTISVFEVDGRKNKIYCQNLCLLSKMFLDHKSLFYDVEPFLFYVVTELDDFGARFVGYFSKEKQSPKDYNVSCIMTLPVRQRQGWGNLLIDFSYLLSKKEQRSGSPEKPLSGLGALGYKNYWTLALMRYLGTAPEHPRLEEISLATSMTTEDIVITLKQQGMISTREPTPPPVKPLPGQSIKLHKGRRNGILRRQSQRAQTNDGVSEKPKGPFVAPVHYDVSWDPDKVKQYLQAWEAKGYLKLKPEKLQWSPYILTRKERVEKESESEKKKQADGIAQAPLTPDAVSATKSSEVASVTDLRSTSPGMAVVPSPINIFDNDVVEEVPRPPPDKQVAQAESPAVADRRSPESSPERRSSRSHLKHSSPAVVAPEERRLTRGGRRTREPLNDETALNVTSPSTKQRPNRALRSRPDELRKPLISSPGKISKTRKRKRVPSSPDVAIGPDMPEVASVEEEKSMPHALELTNGLHTNHTMAHPGGATDISKILLEANATPLALPHVPSAVPVENGAITGPESYRDVKSEEFGTPLTNLTSHSLPSDDTVFATNVPNGKSAPVVEIDDGDADADADGEYEEDAEGELEEDVDDVDGGLELERVDTY